MGNQLWMSRGRSPSTAAARYWSPIVGVADGQTITDTENLASAVVSADGGTLKSMAVRLVTAPGASKSWQVRVVKNGTGSAVLTVTISGSGTSATVVGNVALALDDKISIESIPTGTPAASDIYVTLEYQPTTTDYFLYPLSWNNGDTLAGVSTEYVPFLGSGIEAGLFDQGGIVMPFAATVREVYAWLDGFPFTGRSHNFQLTKTNGASPVAKATYSIVDSDTTSNNTGLSVALSAADRLEWESIPTGGAISRVCKIGVVVQPTTTGLFALNMSSDGTDSNIASTYYVSPVGNATTTGLDATEANVQMPVHKAMTVSAMYVSTSAAENTGSESVVFTLRKNGASTAMTATLNSTTGAAANDTTHPVAFTAGDLISIMIASPGSDGDLSDWYIGLAASLSLTGSPGGGGSNPGGKTPGGRGGGRPGYGYGYGAGDDD